MSAELRAPAPRLPDPDAEQEVDLRIYWRLLAARWWLLLAGLLAGAVVGYLLSLGGGGVLYRARALVYLGQPLSPGGGTPIQSLATNPRTVNEVVRSGFAIRQAAARAGLRPGQLRGEISTEVVSGALPRVAQTPLVRISVQGSGPVKVALAANALAAAVIERVAGYVDAKIGAFQRRLNGETDALDTLGSRVESLQAAIRGSKSLSPLDRLVLISQLDNAEQRRAQLLDEQSSTQQLLALAQNVERPRVVEPAVAERTAARHARTSIVVGAVIGLLLAASATFLRRTLARLSSPD